MIIHRAAKHGEGVSDKVVLCEACGRSYGDQAGLGRHQRDTCPVLKSQAGVEYKYPCEACDEVFSTYGGMASHRYRIHVRREQVNGWAIRAGVVSASDIMRCGSEIV